MKIKELLLTEAEIMALATELKPMLSRAKKEGDKEYLTFLGMIEKKYGKDIRVKVWEIAKKFLEG